MDRPVIGLNMDVVEDEKGVSYFHRSRYTKAVWSAGGKLVFGLQIPLGIPHLGIGFTS